MAVGSWIGTKIDRSGPYLIIIGLFGLYFLWPHFWLWRNNPEPAVMTLEQYLASGSDREWLMLKDAYVDSSGAVRTELTRRRGTSSSYYTYYPLTAGPSDTRPSKVFVQPRHSIAGSRVTLVGPNETVEEARKRLDDSNAVQDVMGIIAIGSLDTYGIRELVRARAAPDAVILLHNQRPPDAIAGIAALLGPIAIGLLGVLIIVRKRKRG